MPSWTKDPPGFPREQPSLSAREAIHRGGPHAKDQDACPRRPLWLYHIDNKLFNPARNHWTALPARPAGRGLRVEACKERCGSPVRSCHPGSPGRGAHLEEATHFPGRIFTEAGTDGPTITNQGASGRTTVLWWEPVRRRSLSPWHTGSAQPLMHPAQRPVMPMPVNSRAHPVEELNPSAP